MTEQIKRELAKIKKRLAVGHWGDTEHVALYAAQQALEWVLDPKDAMAPAKMIAQILRPQSHPLPLTQQKGRQTDEW